MTIDISIFKAYDIRGVYPTQLNEDLAYKIGRAYAHFIQLENEGKKLDIVVGYDMRLSGPQIKKSLIAGLIDSGCNVIDINMVSTPTFYFAVGYYGYDGGIQISASHNPAEYNGFKMVRSKSVPISGDTGIATIRDLVVKNEFKDVTDIGIVTKREYVLDDLLDIKLKDLDLTKIQPFKIVVDAANSVGSLDTQALFERLPCELIKLNFELDGTFPSHEADPFKEENLEQLKESVIENNADLGIALDGDNDRVFIIDDNGDTLPSDILGGILAQFVLKNIPNANIAYDIRPGKITEDLIVEAGGVPFVTKVGHSLIKEVMLEKDSPFGVESSGHFFYKFPYGTFEAPVKMITEFLLWLSDKEQMSEIIKPYKKYFHSGEINNIVDDPDKKIEEIKNKYADGVLSELDGITVTYDTYWFNVRKSNTESKLRLNLEATTRGEMEKRRDEVLNIIKY